MKMKAKRTTIYDIAREVGFAPSSVSKALNDLPSISKKIKTLVKAKAIELNYKHNSNAANLRRGTSKTVGVVVPKINVGFFADAIAGIEEACFENNHMLIICQSDESYSKEVLAVETLIHQNVDCIIISLSQETKSATHLQEIIDHHVDLVQFDRVIHSFKSHTIVNDNENAAYKAVKHLIGQGYRKIAFLGGPDHLTVFRERKQGYLKAIREADLDIPYNYILEDLLKTEPAMQSALALLNYKSPPDAFLTVTDYAALGVLKAAGSMNLKIPEQIGIIGFANETFLEFVAPALSSVDQNSRKLGKDAAKVYFDHVLKSRGANKVMLKARNEVVESSIVIRDSTMRTK
jgi:LacI family transcriptional regulator